MNWMALEMLTGGTGKYDALICGVSFVCLLIAKRTATFCGMMMQTMGLVRDIHGADIWVMHSNVRYVDDMKPISHDPVFRLRGVAGGPWTQNLYRVSGEAQRANGNFQSVFLCELDDAILTCAPNKMVNRKVSDLKIPDSIVVDEAGDKSLWPGEALQVGKTLEMNNRRAVVAGIFKASQSFSTNPMVFTRFGHAVLFVPSSP